ncbi:type 2 periplasmic-binding domain-containing protein [Methylomonas rapida]|uniref:LysR substrate-binding domain-containing protein n=1 Tax=Methylomonas rapida TaxID=2963939 RepID=UPI002E76D11A|nr:LysR substrate-binding domain-containing protein [Methylomonas rapida]
MLTMVRAGIGIALMPEFTIPKTTDNLNFRYLSDPEILRTVQVFFQPASVANPEVNQLLEKMRVNF